ncbi:MAG: exosortase A [Candidatus Competibacteraceae bacterium]|nr:exosortase A [Candidatus Competibacteraceae bacterium]MCP5124381.1 exosortase A [Gammaproteobacteria bacterium]HRX69993.1 exosortase A [Candidatus Competibacteraceae bacterium]
MEKIAVSPTWRTALPALIIALLAIMGLYWPTVAVMATKWWHYETYAHGMLVAPIVLYMIWTRRDELAALQPHGAILGLALVLLISLGWLVADAAQVAVVQHFAVVGIIQATVYALLGGQVAWAMAFPLAYLLFAVPVGEALIPPMQQITAWFTVEGLRLTGIPVLWEGLYIMIPSGNFEIAEACSGLRYLIASVALGFLYAYLTYRSIWRRLAFIALSVIVPIIANGIRAYGIVMIAHLSDMKYATGIDHLIYGWFFFGLVVLMMFWIGSFWREAQEDRAQELKDRDQEASSQSTGSLESKGWRLKTSVGWTVAVILATAVGPLWAMWTDREGLAIAPIVLQAPQAVAPWQGPETDTGTWEPQFSGADVIVRSQYRLNTQTVRLYIAYYRQQRPDAKLVSSQNNLYDRKRWRYLGSAGQAHIQAGDVEWPLQATHLTDGLRKRLVWSGYWEGGRMVVSPYLAKVWEAWDRLSGARRGAALLAVAADYDIQPDEAETVLRQFLQAMQPGIAAALAGVSGEN